jgi:CubicO group peptidase (beta-lactamase class C family)/D-alanyl-D-alanine dipeptidase
LRRCAAAAALAVLVVLVPSACSPPPPDGSAAGRIALDPSYAPIAEALGGAIAGEMERHALPALAIALVDGDRPVWAEAFGRAELDEGGDGDADLDTVFRVGSVSKLFTDIAIMQLVEAGEIDLDAPVTEYLPELTPANPFGAPLTLRQLMAHRSGMVREPPVGHYFDDTEPSLAATVASLAATTLVVAPESEAKYSNAAIAAVGYVVERRTGEPFAAALQRSVLEPLGMDASAFEPTPAVRERLADALMWAIDGREFRAPTFELGMAPAGSMYATVGDLARFMIAMLRGGEGERGRVLEAATLAQMWTPQFADPGADTGFGIGFNLSRLDGHRRVGHGGAIYGFATELAMLPDEGLGVVVVTTRDIANAVTTSLADATLRAALALRSGAQPPAYEPVPSLQAQYTELAAEIAGRRRPDPQGAVADEPIPPPPPPEMEGLIGEYGWDYDVLFVLEHEGRLAALIEWFFFYPLERIGEDRYRFPPVGLYESEQLVFERGPDGTATAAILGIPPQGSGASSWGVRFPRRAVGTPAGATFKITPLRPVEELRAEALAAAPPTETPPAGGFREPDLVELVDLDPTIELDVRYATTNNFMDAVFYEQPRAFLQRPAAEALVRVHRALATAGYGLLIHDAYRPWHVTKMFWDATPADMKAFVANPASGSRHNRGAAVDLTLYELASGRPVQTVGGYDEFTERSFPDYPGGTSRQRWLRELLREAMEAQGFRVYDYEWWHFDYQDWRLYPILNLTFDRIGEAAAAAEGRPPEPAPILEGAR